jgi:hypothetical protein
MGLYGVFLSASIDQPENRRAAIHVLPRVDGGNDSA